MNVFLRSALIILLAMALGSCAMPVRFEGTSMRPTIDDGDRMFVSADAATINRGDIIWFRYPADPEKYYMKRVIGLPGETVRIRDGIVLINDEALEEGYVDARYNQQSSSHGPIVVPADHYFVMGDNRDNSSDSRIWGTVDKSLIEGKYYTTYLKNSDSK
jgi:signal peptidase I